MFKQEPLQLSWNWQLLSEPEQIWPYLTDTNRLFKDLQRPSIQKAQISQSVEPEFIQLSYNGLNRYEVWEEEPYEWEYPFRFGVVRHYQSGPYKDLKLQVDLQPNAQGTRIKVSIFAVPRFGIISMMSTFKLKTIIRRRFKNTIKQYDSLASNEQKLYENSTDDKLVRGGQNRLEQIKEQLYNSEVDAETLSKLLDFIKLADDLELERIRPYELADYWDIPRKNVLEVFIHAAKADLLNFNWDLHCPYCRSIQKSVNTLTQIHEPIFCKECEQEFNINFNKSLQLSFTPHPLVRKIDTDTYCARGPQTKSHVFVQQYLQPENTRYLKIDLPPGNYILESTKIDGQAELKVSRDGKDTVHIDLGSSTLDGEKMRIVKDANLSLSNTSSDPQLVTIHKKKWETPGVSAAQATSSQLFRDLFANEVLKKGEKISVDNLTFMFTDLFDSTSMYNEEGDDKAVGQVINHFEILQEAIAEEDGAIVKTIGDSVMAVFCEPKLALKAYLNAQQMLNEDDRFHNNLKIKAGIHEGSCVAVNLNGRIDYFGCTVNIASRFVDSATENEVIVTQDTFSESDLNELMSEAEFNSTTDNIRTQLKGFEKESFYIKRIQIDKSPLRLAI